VVVTPELENHKPNECKLVTKSITLKLNIYNVGSCSDEACILATFTSAAVSGLISGSIYAVGNTVHWIEQQGKCDDAVIKRSVNALGTGIQDMGGWALDSLNKMKQWVFSLPPGDGEVSDSVIPHNLSSE
jgi:hypothetical protein